MTDKPTFIHDTHHIISANPAACALFRCEELALLDLDMMQLIADAEFRGLARLRMRLMREQVKDTLPNIKYPFLRCDGSLFWASVVSRRLDDTHIESTVHYEDEI